MKIELEIQKGVNSKLKREPFLNFIEIGVGLYKSDRIGKNIFSKEKFPFNVENVDIDNIEWLASGISKY